MLQSYKSVLFSTGVRSIGENPRVAAFDLDSTLITLGKSAGRKKSASSSSDWAWLYPSIPDTLKELHKAGFIVVIFSNQSALAKEGSALTIMQTKLNEIVAALSFKPYIYVASGYDHFRKPGTGMLELFLGDAESTADSFFVGDAAGRITTKPKDFSASDVDFAYNCGLTFYTPEAYFLKDKTSLPGPSVYDIHPEWFSSLVVSEETAVIHQAEFVKHVKKAVGPSDTPFAIFMCGPPASGKTSVAVALAADLGATWLNQDTLKTKAKMMAAIEAAGKTKTSFVLDKMFGDTASRTEYLAAIPKGYKKIIVIMDIQRDVAEHMNWVRAETRDVPCVGDITYATYYAHYATPTTKEGFDAVLKYVPVIADTSPVVPYVLEQRYV
jgi:bifunctional polynucleotide phosphatase/kinase